VRAAATAGLDALSGRRPGGGGGGGSGGLDPGVLLQHYAHVVCGSAGRGRAALVEQLAELAPQVGWLAVGVACFGLGFGSACCF